SLFVTLYGKYYKEGEKEFVQQYALQFLKHQENHLQIIKNQHKQIKKDDVIEIAAFIEILHNCSLIIDDIEDNRYIFKSKNIYIYIHQKLNEKIKAYNSFNLWH
ncbi:hypothetical protein IMG5_193090, partial [Ichthyophthirius multifiliis]